MTKRKPTSQLFHQFLKPQGISRDQLPFLVSKLYEHHFIELYGVPDSEAETYIETEKLTSKQHRDELFKIIQGLKL